MATASPNCLKCKKDQFLELLSRAGDGNYYTLRRGKGTADKQGYMPVFTGLTDSDGCALSVCLACGTVQGLNIKTLRKQVKEAFKDDIVSTKNKKSWNRKDQEEDDNETDEDDEEEMSRITKKKKTAPPTKPQKKSGSKSAKTDNNRKSKSSSRKPQKTSGSKTAKKNPKGKSAKSQSSKSKSRR